MINKQPLYLTLLTYTIINMDIFPKTNQGSDSVIEVTENLFVGNMYDYENTVKHQKDWSTVHACKIPYHKQLLGYSGNAAPKDSPEYLFADRGDRLYLNIVDSPNPKYIPSEIVDKAIDYIGKELKTGKRVLVHCNEGRSRSTIISLLYLATIGEYSGMSLEEAEKQFRLIYPLYSPKTGTRGYALLNWDKYCR